MWRRIAAEFDLFLHLFYKLSEPVFNQYLKEEQTMRKYWMVVFLLFISIIAPFSMATGGNESQPAPKITVVFDEPHPSKLFVNFFYFFNQTMIRWWQEEGRLIAKKDWKISVSEHHDENPKFDGVILAARFTSGHGIVFGFLPVTAKTVKTAAATAADIIILVIKATAKEDKK